MQLHHPYVLSKDMYIVACKINVYACTCLQAGCLDVEDAFAQGVAVMLRC